MLAIVITAIGVVITLVFGWPEAMAQWNKYLNKGKSAEWNGKPEETTSTLDEVLGSRKLQVGVIPFPPLSSYRRVDQRAIVFEGLYIEALKNLGKRLGIEVVFEPLRNDRAMKSLRTGKVHVIACLIRTAERAQNAHFPVLRHTIYLTGVCRKGDTRFNKFSGLRDSDIDVAAVMGEIGSLAVLDFGVQESQITCLQTDDVSDVFNLVESGRTDVAITDGVTCKLYLQEAGDDGKLQFAFGMRPLIVDACGLMTASKQPDFDKWLREEVEISMADDDIARIEKDILDKYRHVINSM